MKKNRLPQLCALFILCGALSCSFFLPQWSTAWQDARQLNRLIPQNQEKPAPVESQSLLEKIELIQEFYGQSIVSLANKEFTLVEEATLGAPLPLITGNQFDGNTALTQGSQELAVLTSLGVLPEISLEGAAPTAQAQLYLPRQSPNASQIIWHLYWDSPQYSLRLLLDDESGKILAFSILWAEKQPATVDAFHAFLQYLGLTPSQAIPYSSQSNQLTYYSFDCQDTEGQNANLFACIGSRQLSFAIGIRDLTTTYVKSNPNLMWK